MGRGGGCQILTVAAVLSVQLCNLFRVVRKQTALVPRCIDARSAVLPQLVPARVISVFAAAQKFSSSLYCPFRVRNMNN